MRLAQHATALLDCSYCHATAGVPCRASGGGPAGRPHVARLEPLIAGWRIGYDNAVRDVLAQLRTARERGYTIAQVEAQLAPWAR